VAAVGGAGPGAGVTDTVGRSAAPPLHRTLGLTDAEYEAIVSELGRPPEPTELAMYSVMWSEHCSYKSSKIHLRTLPTEGPQVLVGPGQDAGVVDVGDGMTPCGSEASTTSATGSSSAVWSPGSAATATASAFRPWAAR